MILEALFLTCQNIFFQQCLMFKCVDMVECVNMVEWTKYDCFSTTSEEAEEIKRLSDDLPLVGQGNW